MKWCLLFFATLYIHLNKACNITDIKTHLEQRLNESSLAISKANHNNTLMYQTWLHILPNTRFVYNCTCTSNKNDSDKACYLNIFIQEGLHYKTVALPTSFFDLLAQAYQAQQHTNNIF